MAAILKEDPPDPLPADVPPALARIVSRCLEKTREARFQSARDLAFGLGGPVAGALTGDRAAAARPSRSLRARCDGVLPWAWLARSRSRSRWCSCCWAPWRRSTTASPLRLSAELGADAPLADSISRSWTQLTLSPAGDVVAFAAKQQTKSRSGGIPGVAADPQLYVRRLDQLQATPLPGTDGALIPFFSPDGRWIGFFAGAS